MHPENMKIISSLLLILISFSLQSSSQDLFTIKGRLSTCRPYRAGNDFGERQLSLIKGKDTIIKNIKTSMGEFVVPGLQPGQYTLRFLNIFNQEVKKSLLVMGNLQEVICCTDSFIDTKRPTFIEKMSAGSKIMLSFESLGCFHDVKSSIDIEKKNSKLIASFYSSRDNKKKTKVLAKHDIEALILFERQLFQMKNVREDCTTVDYYTYTVAGKSVLSVTDGSCDWNGYLLLTKEIFGGEI